MWTSVPLEDVDGVEALIIDPEQRFPSIGVARSYPVLPRFHSALVVNPLAERCRRTRRGNRLELFPIPIVAAPSDREIHPPKRAVSGVQGGEFRQRRMNKPCPAWASGSETRMGSYGLACGGVAWRAP